VIAKAAAADRWGLLSRVLVWGALCGRVRASVCRRGRRRAHVSPVSVVEPTVSVMRSAGLLVVDPRIHADEIARFTSHIVRGPTASDCDIWISAIGADGYGRNHAELRLVRLCATSR
jgi:hypothetical protein